MEDVDVDDDDGYYISKDALEMRAQVHHNAKPSRVFHYRAGVDK